MKTKIESAAVMAKRERYRAKMRCRDNEHNLHFHDHPLNQLAIRSRAEVAKILGVSRQAVHQVERTALFKIRKALMDFRMNDGND